VWVLIDNIAGTCMSNVEVVELFMPSGTVFIIAVFVPYDIILFTPWNLVLILSRILTVAHISGLL